MLTVMECMSECAGRYNSLCSLNKGALNVVDGCRVVVLTGMKNLGGQDEIP